MTEEQLKLAAEIYWQIEDFRYALSVCCAGDADYRQQLEQSIARLKEEAEQL